MRRFTSWCVAGFPAILILFVAVQATAGIISPIGPVSIGGPGLGSAGAIQLTVAPNNDDAGAINPNTSLMFKQFDNVGEIDIVFHVVPSQGVTEYLETDYAINFTGQTWIDYHMKLGFGGFGTPFPFTPAGPLSGLDIDWGIGAPSNTPPPTSSAFATLVHTPDSLDWSNGTVVSGGAVIFGLAIDVPDLNPYIPTWAWDGSGGYFFTIRQLPTIPEPSSLALLGFGLAGCGWLRRRKTAA